MKRYSLFHPLLLSFYSPSLYRDVAENWTGTGFLYLLLLLALCWIPPIVQFHRSTTALLDTLGPAVLEQVPTVSIRQGELSIQEPQPYVITLPGGDKPLVVIDTTGQTTPESTRADLFFTKHQAIFRRSDLETRTYELAGIREMTVDRNSVKKILDGCRTWVPILAYPVALAGSCVYRIIQVLIYAAIGLLFAQLLKVPLEYPQLIRVSSVALTPAILIDTLRGVAGYASSLSWLVFCFLLSMGFLFFAVRANSPVEPDGRELPPVTPPSAGPALG